MKAIIQSVATLVFCVTLSAFGQGDAEGISTVQTSFVGIVSGHKEVKEQHYYQLTLKSGSVILISAATPEVAETLTPIAENRGAARVAGNFSLGKTGNLVVTKASAGDKEKVTISGQLLNRRWGGGNWATSDVRTGRDTIEVVAYPVQAKDFKKFGELLEQAKPVKITVTGSLLSLSSGMRDVVPIVVPDSIDVE